MDFNNHRYHFTYENRFSHLLSAIHLYSHPRSECRKICSWKGKQQKLVHFYKCETHYMNPSNMWFDWLLWIFTETFTRLLDNRYSSTFLEIIYLFTKTVFESKEACLVMWHITKEFVKRKNILRHQGNLYLPFQPGRILSFNSSTVA